MRRRAILIITVSFFVGLLAAVVSLILPNQYTARGLLVVLRKADVPATGFFTYEGNYAQQTSAAYTSTFLSLLQSPDNLMSSGVSQDIRKLSRLIRTKREGSQAIQLSAKGTTPEEAQFIWTRIAGSAINTHEQLKENADPQIFVAKTPNSPVVLNTYPYWTSVFGVAFFTSVTLLTSVIIIIRYLKEENDH